MSPSRDSEKLEVFNIFRIIIILFSVMIICEYYFKVEPPAIIRIKDPKFFMLGPHNTTKYIVQDVYKQLIDIKDFKFTINTQPCKEDTAGLLLMVIISSDPRNYEKRMAIRETWGRVEDSTKVVFLFGETDNAELSKMIVNESLFYRDVVQGNFKDAYRNMTYKHVMGLKWVVHYCPTAKYVLKTDDDVAINIRYLRHYLARQLSPWGARNLILCPVHYHSPVVRWKSKWQVLPSEFNAEYYPDYCFGWEIIYSQDVVYKLLETLQSLPYFWIDDVHVTGVAADKINVPRTDLGSLALDSRRTDLLITSGMEYAGEFLSGPADLAPSKILEIMNAIYMSE